MINNVYFEMLKEIFSEYNGTHEDILKYTPVLFQLLRDTYSEKELCGEVRVEVNCALSYFVVEEDVISDNDSGSGYIDDLYICAYVLNDIYQYDNSIIEKNWGLNEDFPSLIQNILTECIRILGENKCEDIISFTGLSRFKYICDNEGYMYADESKEATLNRLDAKVVDLKALLNFITRHHNHSKSMKAYKELFDSKEWKEVIFLLENLELEEQVYHGEDEAKIEDRINKIKKEVLLAIDESIFED